MGQYDIDELFGNEYFEDEYDEIADELDELYSMYDEYDLYHNEYYDEPNSINAALQIALNTELSTLGHLDFNNNDDWDTIHIINTATNQNHRRMQAVAAQPAVPVPVPPTAPVAATEKKEDKPRRKDVFKEGYEMGQLMKPQEETKEKMAEKSIKEKIMKRLTRAELFGELNGENRVLRGLRRAEMESEAIGGGKIPGGGPPGFGYNGGKYSGIDTSGGKGLLWGQHGKISHPPRSRRRTR